MPSANTYTGRPTHLQYLQINGVKGMNEQIRKNTQRIFLFYILCRIYKIYTCKSYSKCKQPKHIFQQYHFAITVLHIQQHKAED